MPSRPGAPCKRERSVRGNIRSQNITERGVGGMGGEGDRAELGDAATEPIHRTAAQAKRGQVAQTPPQLFDSAWGGGEMRGAGIGGAPWSRTLRGWSPSFATPATRVATVKQRIGTGPFEERMFRNGDVRSSRGPHLHGGRCAATLN